MSAAVDPHDSKRLVKSQYCSAFVHDYAGKLFVYHDLYGYILEMSRDILDFLDEFEEPIDPKKVCQKHANSFGEMTPEAFVGIFIEYGCLVTPGIDELDTIWDRVPVKSRWTVWERDEETGAVTFYAGWGERPVKEFELTPDDAKVWQAFDSETKLIRLAQDYGPQAVQRVIQKLAHHDVQAVKLSKVPLSYFSTKPHLTPPYLTSTMPYAAYDPKTDPPPEEFKPDFSPEAYYEHDVEDAEGQFDHQETTLSHLFRRPHIALSGRTYGEALIDGMAGKGRIPDSGAVTVLEVGGGLGWVAKAVTETLQKRGLEVDYHILELAPALAEAQKKNTDGLPVTVHSGNVLTSEWPVTPDIFIANEMIGDLPATTINHAELGMDKREELEEDEYDKLFQAGLDKLGVAGEIVRKYTIPIGDAPDEGYLNVGAWQLVELLGERLAPGGVAILTEFGDRANYPKLSTQLDHPELSIHFGQMELVGKECGLETDYEFLMDLIDMDRDKQGMRTTRSYFKALGTLLAKRGIELEKIGYTEEMFDELVAGKLDKEHFGEIYFEEIENRLMGLVPFEFKALILSKPAGD